MNETSNLQVALTKNDEISLIDLFAVLWQWKVLIITITGISMIGLIGFSVMSLLLPSDTSPLPNEYTPSALMIINNTSSPAGGLTSMLNSSGLGSLAGLAGIYTETSFSQLAVYLVSSNYMLDRIVDEFNFIERYKIKKYPRSESRKVLKKKLVAAYDEKTGVLSISFTDIDPQFAQSVVNFCTDYLEQRFDELGIDKNKREKENLEKNIANVYKEIQKLEEEGHRLERSAIRGSISVITLELNRITLELDAQKEVYTQLKVQYELSKIALVSEKPIFQILELAEIPDQKSGPSRSLICIIGTFAAAFFSMFLAFVLNVLTTIKENPEIHAKFRKQP
ncbi:MAG: lipopolysaccharide biosynthesis protein [Treponema sp.]|jgi:uncharacterized protein involved in exopolysaccharide biosynthesis|nr:lipopolysaccharide biosynthesis protein [Treponema sp.]